MSSGQKPDKSIELKLRDGDTRFRFLSGWTNEGGRINFKFSDDVVEIVMKDGTVVKPADVWVNHTDWSRMDRSGGRSSPGRGSSKQDDDPPF